MRPDTEAMLMIRPPRPRAIIAPPRTLVQTNVLVRLRSMSVCQVSVGMSWVGMSTRRPPTLLMRMSTGPGRGESGGEGAPRPPGRPGGGGAGDRRPPPRGEGGGGWAGGGWPAPQEGGARPRLGEPERHPAPEPAAPAGDERALPVQPE